MIGTNARYGKVLSAVATAVVLALLVAFLAILGAVALGTQGAPAQTAHAETHSHEGYTPWESSDALPTEAGSYYLTKDVTLGSSWSVPNGEVNLCLNGYGIKATYGRAIKMNGGTFSLYDCGDTKHYFDVDANGKAVNVNNASGDKTFTGGYITGGMGEEVEEQSSFYWSEGGGILVMSGTFNMYGGTILGNAAGHGGGVEVVNATMNLYGGNIIYNQAAGPVHVIAWGDEYKDGEGGSGINLRSYGAAIGEDTQTASLNMYGGNVSYNRGTAIDQSYCYGDRHFNLYGGTISHNNGSGIWGINLTIDGDPVIEGNSGAGIRGNGLSLKGSPVIKDNVLGDVYFEKNDHVLNVTGALDCLPMSVTMQDNVTGVFTSGWHDHMTADPTEYFYSHNTDYVVVTEEGEGNIVDHEHEFSTEWSKDEHTHWHACKANANCQAKEDEAEHVYSDDVDDPHYYICSVCGYEDSVRKGEIGDPQQGGGQGVATEEPTVQTLDNDPEDGKKACCESSHGFCAGWVVFIFMMLELLFLGLYFVLWFPKAAFIAEKCKITPLRKWLGLFLYIGLAVSYAIFLFALIVICVHTCPISIVSFVFAVLILGGFVTFFTFEHKDFVKGRIDELRSVFSAKARKESAQTGENDQTK